MNATRMALRITYRFASAKWARLLFTAVRLEEKKILILINKRIRRRQGRSGIMGGGGTNAHVPVYVCILHLHGTTMHRWTVR